MARQRATGNISVSLHRPQLLTLILTASLALIASPAVTEELKAGHFSTDGLAGWEPKSFHGVTGYSLQQENGRSVVKAASRGSASALVKRVRFDPKRFRHLRWTWKISGTVPGGNEMTKAGDDYAARVYVVFPGRYFWQMRAINYIWANRLPKGESVSSPFAVDSRMVAVESGNTKAGQWIAEERDLLADYRKLFGDDLREAEAVAIMTDTDNTGGSAEAWYGDILLSTDAN